MNSCKNLFTCPCPEQFVHVLFPRPPHQPHLQSVNRNTFPLEVKFTLSKISSGERDITCFWFETRALTFSCRCRSWGISALRTRIRRLGGLALASFPSPDTCYTSPCPIPYNACTSRCQIPHTCGTSVDTHNSSCWRYSLIQVSFFRAKSVCISDDTFAFESSLHVQKENSRVCDTKTR